MMLANEVLVRPPDRTGINAKDSFIRSSIIEASSRIIKRIAPFAVKFVQKINGLEGITYGPHLVTDRVRMA